MECEICGREIFNACEIKRNNYEKVIKDTHSDLMCAECLMLEYAKKNKDVKKISS